MINRLWPWGGEQARVARDKEREFSAELVNFGSPPNNGDVGFVPNGAATGVTPPDIIASVIQRIVSRAMRAELEGSVTALTRAESINPDMTQDEFWRACFESYLLGGNVLLVYKDRRLSYSNSGISLMPQRMWHYSEWDPATAQIRDARARYDKAAMVRWDTRQGQHTLGSAPYQIAEPAVKTYERARCMLHDYAANAHKVGFVISQDAKVTNSRKQVKQYVSSVAEQTKQPGNFKGIHMERGFDLVIPNSGGAPALEDMMSQAVAAVCRVYGVPVQLMCVNVEGDRSPVHELEGHLLRDAVIPMLDKFAAALSRVIGAPVSFNTNKIARPDFEGMVQLLMTLGQSGAFTKNELRAFAGEPPLPAGKGGDDFPETAGAPERDGKTGDANPSGGNSSGGQ